jgi:hypothetical protein
MRGIVFGALPAIGLWILIALASSWALHAERYGASVTSRTLVSQQTSAFR